MTKLNQIKGDLEALLENIKVKKIEVAPIKESKKENKELAENLAFAIIKNAPQGSVVEDIGTCATVIARQYAKKNNLSEKKLVESMLNYYLDIAEELNTILAYDYDEEDDEEI